MSKATEADHQRAAIKFKFMETVWEGCGKLDCLPQCVLSGDTVMTVIDWHCERMERAFATYLIENHPELAKLPEIGGAA